LKLSLPVASAKIAMIWLMSPIEVVSLNAIEMGSASG
jgi:hypothetical protein